MGDRGSYGWATAWILESRWLYIVHGRSSDAKLLSSVFEARHSWKAALSFLYFRIFIIVN